MKYTVLLVLSCLAVTAFSQPGKKTATLPPTTVETHKTVYNMALKTGETNVALISLYYIVAEEGSKSAYKDSMAILYFNMGSYTQCEIVAAEIVKDNADTVAKGGKLPVLEVLALSQSALGKTKEAIASFEKLLPLTNEMFHAYRLAELQFLYKRYGESVESIKKAENLKNSLSSPITIDMGNNQAQQVQLEAAVMNLKGFIWMELYPNELDKAIGYFSKALEIQPNFVLAKNNLEFAVKKKNPEPAVSPDDKNKPVEPKK